eukprot:scpid68760/ scgid26620/ 
MRPSVINSYSTLPCTGERLRSACVVRASIYCGIEGNDSTDHLSKLGCDKDQENIDPPVQAAKAFIHSQCVTAFLRLLLNLDRSGNNTERRTTSARNQHFTGHSSILSKDTSIKSQHHPLQVVNSV